MDDIALILRHARGSQLRTGRGRPPIRPCGASLEWCREEGFVWVALHASVFGRPLYESLGLLPASEMRLRLK